MDDVKPYKIASLEVDFSGSGDSGEITDIRFYVSKGKKIEQANWDSIPKVLADRARDVVNDEMIGKLGGDWWNNDGGYGSVVVDFRTGKASIEANYYEMRVADTENLELDLNDIQDSEGSE